MKNTWMLVLFLSLLSCEKKSIEKTTMNEALARESIIETLKLETKFFCERDLSGWQAQWSQAAFTSKMYAGQHEFEQFTGWEAINGFTVSHIAENPEPIPLPDTNFDMDIHLLGETAWVFYSKNVEGQQVKESRFMVLEGTKWKIARMQTIF